MPRANPRVAPSVLPLENPSASDFLPSEVFQTTPAAFQQFVPNPPLSGLPGLRGGADSVLWQQIGMNWYILHFPLHFPETHGDLVRLTRLLGLRDR